MENPFNPKSEREKFDFFSQMTTSIDKWIAECYPKFSNEFHVTFEKMSSNQKIIEKLLNDYQKKEITPDSLCLTEFKNELKAHVAEVKLSKSHLVHELCSKAEDLIRNLELQMKNLEKEMKVFHSSYKKVYESATLFEDVYSMRDEFKDFKDTIAKLKKNMKNMFKDIEV